MPPTPTVLVLVALLATIVTAAPPATVVDKRLDELEARLIESPDSLRLGSEYRQLIIATSGYDRSIKLFERLSNDPRGGANRYINLALAYVDKVPVAGTIRQALLGRNAINATSRAIEIAPDPIAYLIRGLVNLYYDRAIYHRTDKGVADLEQAKKLALLTPQFPMERVYIALGDGYWRWNQPGKARQVWRDGLALYENSEGLRKRLDGSDKFVNETVEHALDPGVRVDTTLREVFPDLPIAIKLPNF
jgi:hypothetical protein